jgi:exopolyphosphatase / guanosine-5'-triphosphate,3'-diphosphate pyrophosphatase
MTATCENTPLGVVSSPSTGGTIRPENRIGSVMGYRGAGAAARSGRNPPSSPPFAGGAGSGIPGSAGIGAGGRGRFPARNTYAALDLGTNNCRMLIARPEGERFAVVDAFSRIVRLGEGLAASGRLSDAAMDRAVSALGVCAAKLMRRNVTLSHAVATEACRRASNGDDFIDRVYRETGLVLDVISPEDEAQLAVMGCHQLIEPGDGPAMVFDIGGGSTELILVDTSGGEPRTLDWLSVPWGVVSLAEHEPANAASRDDRIAAYARMKATVADSFARFAAPHVDHDGPLRLLGTSGTVTTLASVHLGLISYDRRAIDGLIVPVDSMREISARLAAMSLQERIDLNCIGSERADLVVAGCAILDAILDVWPAVRVGVADRGIREGILRRLIGMERRS